MKVYVRDMLGIHRLCSHDADIYVRVHFYKQLLKYFLDLFNLFCICEGIAFIHYAYAHPTLDINWIH